MSVPSWFVDKFFVKQPRARELITRALSGSEDRTIDVFGAQMRINSLRENGYLRASRLSASSSLLRDEVPVLLSLAMLLRPGLCFVDVGANVGVFSCALARVRKLTRNVSFHAFEAHPDTFKRLAANAEPLGVTCHNFAVSDSAGTLAFVDGAVSHVFTRQEQANSYNIRSRISQVETRRLDSFSFSGPIGMKIDVEGQELEVLNGAKGLFDANAVAFVYIDGYRDQKVLARLQSCGMKLLDARTLEPAREDTFALLAFHPAMVDAV
jgi:FkbM family methyltransferase